MKKVFVVFGIMFFLFTDSHAGEPKTAGKILKADHAASAARNLYLDLMKRSLTNWIYGDSEKAVIKDVGFLNDEAIAALRSRGLLVVKPFPMDPLVRALGRDWPPDAHTMIGLKRLDNLQLLMEDVLSRKVPGDFIECGAWRGGATIFMRAVLKAYDIKDRRVFVADSFEGSPKPDLTKFPYDDQYAWLMSEDLAVSLEEVKANFDAYGLLDGQVYFLKGWFKDTLPTAPIKKMAILRVDADLYESTMDALVNLYPKVSKGGYIIIDDFNLEPARKAAFDYRKDHGINDKIVDIDGNGVYWQKSF